MYLLCTCRILQEQPSNRGLNFSFKHEVILQPLNLIASITDSPDDHSPWGGPPIATIIVAMCGNGCSRHFWCRHHCHRSHHPVASLSNNVQPHPTPPSFLLPSTPWMRLNTRARPTPLTFDCLSAWYGSPRRRSANFAYSLEMAVLAASALDVMSSPESLDTWKAGSNFMQSLFSKLSINLSPGFLCTILDPFFSCFFSFCPEVWPLALCSHTSLVHS